MDPATLRALAREYQRETEFWKRLADKRGVDHDAGLAPAVLEMRIEARLRVAIFERLAAECLRRAKLADAARVAL
jgi:hypothetical protein